MKKRLITSYLLILGVSLAFSQEVIDDIYVTPKKAKKIQSQYVQPTKKHIQTHTAKEDEVLIINDSIVYDDREDENYEYAERIRVFRNGGTYVPIWDSYYSWDYPGYYWSSGFYIDPFYGVSYCYPRHYGWYGGFYRPYLPWYDAWYYGWNPYPYSYYGYYGGYGYYSPYHDYYYGDYYSSRNINHNQAYRRNYEGRRNQNTTYNNSNSRRRSILSSNRSASRRSEYTRARRSGSNQPTYRNGRASTGATQRGVNVKSNRRAWKSQPNRHYNKTNKSSRYHRSNSSQRQRYNRSSQRRSSSYSTNRRNHSSYNSNRSSSRRSSSYSTSSRSSSRSSGFSSGRGGFSGSRSSGSSRGGRRR